jgi:hypothetical protein
MRPPLVSIFLGNCPFQLFSSLLAKRKVIAFSYHYRSWVGELLLPCSSFSDASFAKVESRAAAVGPNKE